MAKLTKFELFCEQHPWLTGEKEWKRALAIYGYCLLAGLMIYGGLLVVVVAWTILEAIVNA